jgi:hypothetical protein
MSNVNEGSNGFHLFTVVTDGYGNLISEDHEGQALAQVEVTDGKDGKATPDAFKELARLTFAVLEGDEPPLHEAY